MDIIVKDWNRQLEITSECPTCHKEWTRMIYEAEPWGVAILAMCDECVKKRTDENGNFTITLTRTF